MAKRVKRSAKRRNTRGEMPSDVCRYFLFLSGSIDYDAVLDVIGEVAKITEPKEDVEIDLVVTSLGGSAHRAFQIVTILREKCCTLRSVVPLYAKSAATLLVLGSDEIIMGPQSELGPLDVQIESPEVEGRVISALDHIGSLEYLSGFAIELAFKAGLRARRDVFLGRKDSVKLGLDFAVGCIQPLVSRLDPSLLTQSYRTLEVAKEYAVRLMQRRVLDESRESEQEARGIAETLVEHYKAHEFVIDREEAKQLGLRGI